MTFSAYVSAAKVAEFNIMGESVSYHQAGGVVSAIQAIIDPNAEPFPGGFDSAAPERRTEIQLLKADAPNVRGGELIVTDAVTYELADFVDDPGPVVIFTARRRDG